MFKLKLFIATAAAASLAVLSAGAAHAAYQDPGFQLSVDNPTVVGGNPIHGDVDSEQYCDFTITFEGDELNYSGTHHSFTFDTPKVDEKTEVNLDATCTYDDGNAGVLTTETDPGAATPAIYRSSAQAVLPAVTQVANRTALITLLPEGGDNGPSGALPDTGGPDQSLLLLGGSLIAVGAGTVVMARRKRTA